MPRECLPVEYGGTNGTMQDIIDRMEAKLFQYRDYFMEEPNYGTEETLRSVHRALSIDNDFGTEGSFKQLEFD